MAVCLLNNGLTKDAQCGYSLPKIVELYLANFGEVAGTTVAENEVTAITMVTSGEGASATTAQWYKVEPAINSASWSDNLGVGGSGNKYRIHTVGFSYSSAYNSGMVDTVDALSLGKYLAVARMADGSYLMFGRNVGLEADADGVNNSGSGDASAEAGLVVSLTANTLEAALPLSTAAIATVTGTGN